MREQWRGFRLLVSTAVRTDPWRTFGLVLEPIGRLAWPLAGLWLSFLTDGVLQDRGNLIVAGIIGLLAGVVGNWGISLCGNMMRITLSEKVGFAFDREITRLTADLPGLDHHERADYQDRLELLRQSQGALGGAMNSLINSVANVVGGAGVIVMLVVVHPLLLVLVLFALPAIPVARLEQRWNKQAEEESATPSRQARHLRRLAYDRGAGMEIRVFGLQEELRARSREAWRTARRPAVRAAWRRDLAHGIQEIVYALAFVAAIGFVLWRATRGQSSVGEVVMAVYTCARVQQVVWAIHGVARLGQSLRAAGRMLWLRDYAATADARRSGRAPEQSIADGIVFENVSFRYPGTERWILRGMSLHIPAGGVVALVGENGAGKSTLVKLLARMYEPTEGRILVDGVDLAELDVDAWRERLSAAFQDFAKFELVAQQTVGVGDLSRLDDEAAVTAALDRAGAADVVPKLPQGVASQLGSSWEDGVDLSTGQWQKLALGRALMREAPLVVFFDEPTASLDAPTEHALFERYTEASRAGAARGMITVLVSHRFSTVRSADLILVIDDGRIAELGSHAELMEIDGLYAELYTLQARSYA
ncbi:ABC transporter ATP-binding protein [Actinopolymorpha pittospori]|uniref:ATP-binding cassette subfamily B protein n=1 Tax=Actinopolymorpha pittospori TaxID=648752 RepID=A0A927N3H3_9ACTN|nr:ABC transporter ATP-binding protein [Actinopolymorpha pittospori]MBE1608262.1 ATP-binding cassette subfamily B protein [Actinopolymorpha pittospori]